jgi:hypothetical protein
MGSFGSDARGRDTRDALTKDRVGAGWPKCSTSKGGSGAALREEGTSGLNQVEGAERVIRAAMSRVPALGGRSSVGMGGTPRRRSSLGLADAPDLTAKPRDLTLTGSDKCPLSGRRTVPSQRLRAKVEHPIGVIKRVFGVKVRYRGFRGPENC